MYTNHTQPTSAIFPRGCSEPSFHTFQSAQRNLLQYKLKDFWYGMEMEWKKIAGMEYGKIIFHSIPYHALTVIIIIIIFIYLPSDITSQEKTATSSRSITKASKYAIPLKPTHKLAESKRYLVTW